MLLVVAESLMIFPVLPPLMYNVPPLLLVISPVLPFNTFITPKGTKYARFNYAIVLGIFIERLNERCMLVYGDKLPTNYTPYYKTSLIDKINDIGNKIEQTSETVGLFYYNIKNDEI